MTGILGLSIFDYISRLFSSVLENINYFNDNKMSTNDFLAKITGL